MMYVYNRTVVRVVGVGVNVYGNSKKHVNKFLSENS